MKIKQDFVTNSSSSSFVVFGVSLEDGELRKALESKLVLGENEEDNDEAYENLYEEVCYERNVEYHVETNDGEIIGISPDEILKNSDAKIGDIGKIVANLLEERTGLKIDPKRVKLYSGEYRC